MNHEMKVKLAIQLGIAAEYRGRGNQESAEFLEESVFDRCLSDWQLELMKERKYFDGVDKMSAQERKKTRLGHIINKF